MIITETQLTSYKNCFQKVIHIFCVCFKSESREILLDVSVVSDAGVQGIILDVNQLEQENSDQPVKNDTLPPSNAVNVPQNWTNWGIFMCVAYNLFLLIILLVILKIFK